MVGPYSNMTSALKPKEKFGHREGSCHVMTEAEIKCMLPQNKKCMGLPKAGRGKEESSRRVFGEDMTLPTP